MAVTPVDQKRVGVASSMREWARAVIGFGSGVVGCGVTGCEAGVARGSGWVAGKVEVSWCFEGVWASLIAGSSGVSGVARDLEAVGRGMVVAEVLAAEAIGAG